METPHPNLAALAAKLAGAPKVELHAHLHGCARIETLAQLAQRRGGESGSAATAAIDAIRGLRTRSLKDCFKLFSLIHELVQDEAALRYLAAAVLDDFAADEVHYLELRSTPRPTGSLTASAYLDLVLDELAAAERRHPHFSVRYLVSVNRASPAKDGERALDAVAALTAERRKLVVGLDLSGDPTKGSFNHFVPILKRARQMNLGITVHCGEVVDDAEVAEILAFRPERLGHALQLPHAIRRTLTEPTAASIPIECCPSSNCKTLELDSLRSHPHLGTWIETNYPIALCTDDSGVFQTTLTKELAMVGHSFGLSAERLAAIAVRPLDFAFAPPDVLDRVRQRIALWNKSRL